MDEFEFIVEDGAFDQRMKLGLLIPGEKILDMLWHKSSRRHHVDQNISIIEYPLSIGILSCDLM